MEIETICPAKVNLFLEVLGKRPDGYHEIRTLFQKLDVGDFLRARSSQDISLSGGESLGIEPGENLILKAAQRLKEKSGISAGVEFQLIKILPAGAGLGGGSSDAAGALTLCNKLWGLNYSTVDLQEIAAPLGADIPFFLNSSTAFGFGSGTQLKPAPSPLPFWVLVATPHSFVPTGDAYKWLNAPDLNPNKKTRLNQEEVEMGLGSQSFYSNFFNDFHSPVLSHFPDIFQLDKKIREFSPELCLLSGSGSSLFALFGEKSEADSCLEAVSDQCRFTTVCGWKQDS